MMMQEKYRRVVESLSTVPDMALRRWFYLRREGSLHDAADDAGLCQADLVLLLLERGHLSAAEHLVGRRIRRAPPLRIRGAPPPRLGPDDRRVHVLCRPSAFEGAKRQLNTTIYVRMDLLLKEGQPLRRALARGVRRRDVTLAVKRGYMTLEELPESRRN
jgi:hypothetical protein